MSNKPPKPTTLRKELIGFAKAADSLIEAIGETPPSPFELAIINFYSKEIPAKAAKGTA